MIDRASLFEGIDFNLDKRVQYLIVALLVTIATVGLLELSEIQDNLSAKNFDLERQLRSLVDGQSIDWTERGKLANDVGESWLATRWHAETAGIASANIQKKLSDLTRDLGMESVRLSVASDLVSVEGNDLLRYEIAGIGTANVLAELIVELSVSEKILMITDVSASIREDQTTDFTMFESTGTCKVY